MVDDDVHHDRAVLRQRRDVLPRPEPLVHLRVVHRVEAGVRAVEGPVERQNVHPAEQPRQRSVEQLTQAAEVAAEAVGVGDQLNISSHAGLLGHPPGASFQPDVKNASRSTASV